MKIHIINQLEDNDEKVDNFFLNLSIKPYICI